MARPSLLLGTHGSITVKREDGRWVARCRYRDLDGKTGRVERWDSTKNGAAKALQDELRDRVGGPKTLALGPTSFFREAADLWFAKIQERRADSTTDTNANCLKKQVLPKLCELRLAECTVARLDTYAADHLHSRLVRHVPCGLRADQGSAHPEVSAEGRGRAERVAAVDHQVDLGPTLRHRLKVDVVRLDLQYFPIPRATRSAGAGSAGAAEPRPVAGRRAGPVSGGWIGLRGRLPRGQRRDPRGQRLVGALGVVDVVERVDLGLQFAERGRQVVELPAGPSPASCRAR
jgi:hypothetical protein